MSKSYPDIKTDQYHIDILCAHFVLNPDKFDVIVASNLFGDILSDLGPACTGTIGIAPSGNINPENNHPSLFEPVHGSAPDIAGKGIANPIGQIWAGAMMLNHFGFDDASNEILNAIKHSLSEPKLRTKDLAGSADTQTVGKSIEQIHGMAIFLGLFIFTSIPIFSATSDINKSITSSDFSSSFRRNSLSLSTNKFKVPLLSTSGLTAVK